MIIFLRGIFFFHTNGENLLKLLSSKKKEENLTFSLYETQEYFYVLIIKFFFF